MEIWVVNLGEAFNVRRRVRPVSYENRIILRAIILNTHGSREAPKTHGLTYVLLAQNFGVIRRKILVKFCTLKNGF